MIYKGGMSVMNLESILFRLSGDLDGDIVRYNGTKYYVHVIDGIVRPIKEELK